MHERETLFALNREAEFERGFHHNSFVLARRHHPQSKPLPVAAINVIVLTGFERQSDLGLFGPDPEIFFVEASATMADLWTRLGFFPSKGQARKTGLPKFAGPIPDGWSEAWKGDTQVLFIWKPTM